MKAIPARIPALLLLAFAACLNAQTVPRSSHVWIITEENHSYESVVGSSQMPYYNRLIQQYGLAAQFYSNQHSSLPALMWFVAGAPVELNNNTTSCDHKDDNVVGELLKQGYTWRSYQQNMPYAGYQGLKSGTTDAYYRRHNPLIDFSDVCPGTVRKKIASPTPSSQPISPTIKRPTSPTSLQTEMRMHMTARSRLPINGFRPMSPRFSLFLSLLRAAMESSSSCGTKALSQPTTAAPPPIPLVAAEEPPTLSSGRK